jgi:uncharacterized protein with von Willebrand factor type A (vWA) domain
MLIQCLDNSASMKGAPMRALLKGARHIGKLYFAQEENSRACDKLQTVLFNRKTTLLKANSEWEYNSKICDISASGATDFLKVFNLIEDILMDPENADTTDLTVIFFTDGADTCNYDITDWSLKLRNLSRYLG